MARDKDTLLRKFHEARWDEPIICEMSVPGERGILVPKADVAIAAEVGDGISAIPESLQRKEPPALPEVSQMRVNRHFMHLSQETLGTDVNIDISQGTCTMKYSPKVQEHVAARHPGITEIHPNQDPDTIQGILEIYYKLEGFLKEISGLDNFSLQPGGGAHSVYANASVVRAYHKSRGDDKRDEIITTMFSHPCDAATPATAGYKVITLMPDKNGYPDLEAMKSALSERTAGIFITNPEDTGIYNPRIEEYVNAAHAVGALCSYDQANANSMLGIAGPGKPDLICAILIYTRPFPLPMAAWGLPWELRAYVHTWPNSCRLPAWSLTARDTFWTITARRASARSGPLSAMLPWL